MMKFFSAQTTASVSNGVQRFFEWSRVPIQSLGGAAFVIALSGIGSRLLGFVRDRLLASSFGAGDILDAYYAAFRVPDLIYSFLVLGALSAAFIPLFTGLLTKGEKEQAWELSRGVLTLLSLTLGTLALLGMLGAPWLAVALAPGFSAEKQMLVADLTRIMLLSPLFLGVSAVFGGVLVSLRQFLMYSLAPIFYNLGIIGGILWLYPSLGTTGLAWGVVLGALLHLLVQYPGVRAAGFRFRFDPGAAFRSSPVHRVARLMLPRSLAMAVNQVSLLVVTVFASTLVSGSLAAFTLAMNIQSVPLGLFGIAFALSAFPALSALAARERTDAFFDTLAETALRILYFVLPLSVLMLVFRAEVVRVTLGTGAFNWEDTILTFHILGFFALSLFAQSLIPLFVRAFFALENTKTPLYAALIAEAVHLSLIPFFLVRLEAAGIALAFSIGAVVHIVLLYLFLRPRIPGWRDRHLLLPAGKMLLAAAAAGVVAQLSKSLFALAIDRLDTFVEVFAKLTLGTFIGLVVYVLLSMWFHFPEFKSIIRFLQRKLFRGPEAVVATADHPEKGDW